MVRPSTVASASPTLANTSSREPATVKPSVGAAGGVEPEAVTGAPGTFTAASVRGRSRSGGTSSGRVSSLCAYSLLGLRNQLQPEVAPMAATTRTATAVRRRETLERMEVLQ